MSWQEELERIVSAFGAESGTVHLLGSDSVLHLEAAYGVPAPVLELVRLVPFGKGMAGLAVQRNEPITVCNLSTDTSGDVQPGARATGMEGALVVPIRRDGEAIGALGIANRAARTFSAEETERLLGLAEAYAGTV